MVINSQHYTDTGLRASINQDSILNLTGDILSVFCVADGMGGHKHGELASKAIVDRIERWYSDISAEKVNRKFNDLIDNFELAIEEANKQIHDDYNKDGICGSTVVALIIYRDKYAIFSAGDSRIYRKRGFKFTQITSDDVWQNTQAADLDSSDVLSNPKYGKLTKSVGVNESVTLNRITGQVKKRDSFFLCCDGVYKCVPPKLLKRIYSKPEELKKAVIKAGAPDNYSFINVQIKDC